MNWCAIICTCTCSVCVCVSACASVLAAVCGQSVVAAVGGTAGQADNRV